MYLEGECTCGDPKAAQRGCLLGGVCPEGGMSVQEGGVCLGVCIPAYTGADIPPHCEQND